jgi:hypothetical protein
MKYVNYLGIVALFAMVFSFSAFAKDKTVHSVTIGDPVTVGTTHLKPGDYKVEWHGSTPAVQVDFLQNGKTVATAPAKLETNDSNVVQDEVVTDRTNSKSRTLKEIDFAHQKEALVFTQSAM